MFRTFTQFFGVVFVRDQYRQDFSHHWCLWASQQCVDFFAKALLEVQRTGSRLLFCADLEFWTQGMDTVANEGSLFDVFDFSELTHHFSVDFLTRGGKNCLRCMENSDSTRAQRRMRSREKGAV